MFRGDVHLAQILVRDSEDSPEVNPLCLATNVSTKPEEENSATSKRSAGSLSQVFGTNEATDWQILRQARRSSRLDPMDLRSDWIDSDLVLSAPPKNRFGPLAWTL